MVEDPVIIPGMYIIIQSATMEIKKVTGLLLDLYSTVFKRMCGTFDIIATWSRL
jgi:hypothetical protein